MLISMQRRIAHLPLHGGRAPTWLFQRMHRLYRLSSWVSREKA